MSEAMASNGDPSSKSRFEVVDGGNKFLVVTLVSDNKYCYSVLV